MATEKRLIDATDALNCLEIALQKMKNVTIAGFKAVPMDEVIRFVATRPTVYAVEVVRCKECRFWHEDTVSCSFVTADTNWYAEDYCSYGERKDNG